MKFSIITPSYNQARYLAQTLESVASQAGNFEIEHFIMDGGSTDNSVKVIKDYVSKYKKQPHLKIYWLSRPDKGQVDALNQAIPKVTGDIVAYINSDDYYLPQAFSSVQQHFLNHPSAQWLVGNCQISDPGLSWTFWLKHLWPINYFKNALLVFNTINQPSVFLKKDLVNEIGLFDQSLHYAFDYDYWLRCNKIMSPSRLHLSLSVFRVHPQSKGNSNFSHQFDEDWLVFIKQQPNDFLYFIHALAKNFVKFIYSFLK
ncbi:glycosyltransferase [Candidatus Shapirobacteria bacterium]|nr:glycosyltransferase [Candidatus Shapirobacteria bacterium]